MASGRTFWLLTVLLVSWTVLSERLHLWAGCALAPARSILECVAHAAVCAVPGRGKSGLPLAFTSPVGTAFAQGDLSVDSASL